MKNRKWLALTTVCAMTAASLMGCSGGTASDAPADTQAQTGTTQTEAEAGESTEAAKELSGTITFTIWDNNLNDFIEQNDMVGKFQEMYPDAEIEVEKIKDDEDEGICQPAAGCYVQ